jgi:hypothetical protein
MPANDSTTSTTQPKRTRAEQARVNGAKSRGPTTQKGKNRSRLNALKHGRYARLDVILSNEDPEALEQVLRVYEDRLAPRDNLELRLVRELAGIDWRLTRYRAMETRRLENEMEIQAPAFDTVHMNPDETLRVTAADRSLYENSRSPAFVAFRESRLLYARESVTRTLTRLRNDLLPLKQTNYPVDLIANDRRNEPKITRNKPRSNRQSNQKRTGISEAA